ncbi:FtsB family cell division protein [Hippea maritima]|uniref:Septum formation initiator n=1 Tax=Hippea maritima (strain ATCC 700847 / DSM 10411 / MH2) TaxID=760142 RepID=F2LVJ5_HIPMA|nr:septum formation initiator family protein [Hippea maritima]AEA33779.1 Septum formation initiator [Hippea maritima DSM 10411]
MVNIRHGSRLIDVIILFAALITTGLIGKGIYDKQIQLRELKEKSSLLDKRIETLNSNIEKIKREIDIAKSDPYYLKQKASDRYLMINKDESIIIFEDGK